MGVARGAGRFDAIRLGAPVPAKRTLSPSCRQRAECIEGCAEQAALEALPTVGTATVAAVAGNLDRAGLEGGASVDDQGGRVCAAYDYDVFVEVQFETEHGDVPRLRANKARLVNARRGAGAKVFVYADGSSYSFDGCPSGDCPTFASRAGDTENAPCSNRGTCDRVTGICTCFLGYGMSDGLGGRGTIADCGYKLPH